MSSSKGQGALKGTCFESVDAVKINDKSDKGLTEDDLKYWFQK